MLSKRFFSISRRYFLIVALLSVPIFSTFTQNMPCVALETPVSKCSLYPVCLQCESQTDPLAVDVDAPLLSWVPTAADITRRAVKQVAYRVRVATSEELLKSATATADLWDSGWVESSESLNIGYEGKPLTPRQRAFWTVQLRDERGNESPVSLTATFIQGVGVPSQSSSTKLQDSDLSIPDAFATSNAKWVTAPDSIATAPETKTAAPIFYRGFDSKKNATVKRALVSVCGLGTYRLTLNGQRVGDAEQAPAWSNYRKTCYYDTYDVTSHIVHNPALQNAIFIELGNGMYNVVGGRYVKFTGSFGTPKFILRMDVEYTDGTTEQIVSDERWRVTTGPTVFNCVYGGEDYDARREIPQLTSEGIATDETTFAEQEPWQLGVVCEGPGGVLRAAIAPTVCVQQKLETVRITEPQPGIFVYDLGQNHSGFPTLSVHGQGANHGAGQTVKLIPGEQLDENGLVTQRSSGGPVSFSYTLRGDGQVETWSPKFMYYGYRYVQVEGAVPQKLPVESAENSVTTTESATIASDATTSDTAIGGLPKVVALSGNWIYSSSRVVGGVTASDPKVEQIHTLIRAAIRSNFQNVLTDCPHREKLGWLEVAHLLYGGFAYNYDVRLFYEKIARDGIEGQTSEGLIPDIVPEYVVFSGGFRDSPEWGAAIGIDAVYSQHFYADTRMSDVVYETVKRYATYLESQMVDGLVQHGLGDWCDIGPNPYGVSQLTSLGVTATGAYYQTLSMLESTAIQLGKTEEAAEFTARKAAVKKRFNEAYFHPETHSYDRESQTAQAVPLVVGLVEESERPHVLDALVKIVERDQYHVTAGDVGFSYVVKALTDGERSDILWKIIRNEDGPGYCDQLRKGATTLTESWSAHPAFSHNHCMLGHAEEWFYRGLLGIRCDTTSEGVGFKRFVLAPQMVDGVDSAEGFYDSVRGRIGVQWQRTIAESGQVRYVLKCDIPANTTAEVRLPNAMDATIIRESEKPLADAVGIQHIQSQNNMTILEVGSGVYRFEW